MASAAQLAMLSYLSLLPIVALLDNDADNGLVQGHLRESQLHHAVLRLRVLETAHTINNFSVHVETCTI